MAPFFLDVWMEMASKETAKVVSEKKTLFFFPVNDDVMKSAPKSADQDASQA